MSPRRPVLKHAVTFVLVLRHDFGPVANNLGSMAACEAVGCEIETGPAARPSSLT